jgi:GNAT superfamily N-acetyltransferase
MAERAAYVCRQVVADDEGDVAELVRLRVDWSRSQGLEPTPDFAERFGAWWARQSGHRVAWLARPADGGAAVGMANVTVFERMPKPGKADARWAYVGNVWVDVEHRRRGVGAALMADVVQWCRDAGMHATGRAQPERDVTAVVPRARVPPRRRPVAVGAVS